MIEAFNLDPPPGFEGLNPSKSIQYYMRDLPHWRQEGATYFVTFRLADSLPQAKLRELEVLRREWILKFQRPESIDQIKSLSKEVMMRVEKWLDQGCGECRLRRKDAWNEVASAMHYFDQDRYELGSYVVMPNHVHVVVKPLMEKKHPLEKVLQSWKRYTSRTIHKLDEVDRPACDNVTNDHPPLWQPESFDRIIRNEEHLYHVIQYIGRNPRLANLSPGHYCRWLKPKWNALGYQFDRN